MLTYSVWLGIVSEFNYYTTAFEKIAWYSFGAFLAPFVIILDIGTSPFQLIGILIYFITKRRNK